MSRKVVAALGAIALLGAACSSSDDKHASPTTTTTVAKSATTTTTTEPLPAGALISDLTWISESHGWALAAVATCASQPCMAVLTTTDSGNTWRRVDSKGAPLSNVSHLRFVNTTVGYAFGPALMMTTDGGVTWAIEPGPSVDQIEGNGRDVIRLSYGDTGCPGPCGWKIERATVGSNDWHKLPAPAPRSSAVKAQLVRQGHDDVYAAFYGNPAGGIVGAYTDLQVSHDDGGTWTSHDDPCKSAPGDEYDSVAFATAPGGALAAICASRQTSTSSVVVSTNGGSTFGPRRGVNGKSFLGSIAMTGANDLAVASGATSGSGPFTYEVDVSHDAGRTWTTAVADPESLTAGAAAGPAFLGFESAKVGRWVGDPKTIWTTNDGGDHWTAHQFT